MPRVAAHGSLERLAHPGEAIARAPLEQLPLDLLEREDRLAEGERQLRADLEDREVVLDQGAKGVLGLVVGRVRLEDEAPCALAPRAQARRGLAPVGKHDVVAELDAGLDDQRQDALPGALEPSSARRPRASGRARARRPPRAWRPAPRGRRPGRRAPGPRCRSRRRAAAGPARAPPRPPRPRRARSAVRSAASVSASGPPGRRRSACWRRGGSSRSRRARTAAPSRVARSIAGRRSERRPGIRAEVVAAQHHAPGRQSRLVREPGDEAPRTRPA